ncbi:hypothetical protein Vadar_010675 [Vaccinium darrowii]|uniref:Uncharacterized protein n=1 Tax=Vaccinium darrowii TaxID=229202 RepID=A0ACB7X9V9_9ERIC|nr:hypothetical protein Vadar_010675 [Vaccinium darrowii]
MTLILLQKLVGAECRLERLINELELQAAVEAMAEFLNKAVKPVLVARDWFQSTIHSSLGHIGVLLVGYSLLIKKEKYVIVQPNCVTIGNGPSLGWVFMADFSTALAKKLKNNNTAYENYRRIFVPPGIALERENNEPLRDNMLFNNVQVWENSSMDCRFG